MYRPLYWFGQGRQPTMNPPLSLAAPPVYSEGNTVVTIHLKPYLWSDGKPVDQPGRPLLDQPAAGQHGELGGLPAGRIPGQRQVGDRARRADGPG